MSGRVDKKIRQQYRKDFGRAAREHGELIANMMKPKPRLIPWRAWFWMMGFFIKIKKPKKGEPASA